MINMEELKPILEGLLEGREDAADVIEQVAVLDKPVEVDRSEIDALNASWNDRFKKAFFGEKAADISEEIPSIPEADETVDDTDVEEVLTYDNLFEEVKEEKEEKEED